MFYNSCPFLKRLKITIPSQELTLAYSPCIYIAMQLEKGPGTREKSSSMLSAFYILYLWLSLWWIFWRPQYQYVVIFKLNISFLKICANQGAVPLCSTQNLPLHFYYSTQNLLLHFHHSTRSIWLLRLYHPKYPSTHKLMMPIIHFYTSKSSSKIYRCWIVWGRNFRVVIIPSILTLAYLGLSIYFDLLPDFNILPLGIWSAGVGAAIFFPGDIRQTTLWGFIATDTSLAISMVVNALVTGLIVYRIFKVFRELQQVSTSTEKSLGVRVIGGRKLRSIIFVIIESGFALFLIQLVRVTLTLPPLFWKSTPIYDALTFIMVTHQMFNVIITLVIINLYFADNVDLARV